MQDVQAERDERGVALDRVGITELEYPLTILRKEGGTQQTVARIEASVYLPQEDKGTHMSRFIEVLHPYSGAISMNDFPALLERMRERLQARTARAAYRFPYAMLKRAPISGAEAWQYCTASFCGTIDDQGQVDFRLGVEVLVTSLCPCSKVISAYGAHNQRGRVSLEMRPRQLEPGETQTDGVPQGVSGPWRFVWIEDLVALIERAASAPLYPILKRTDEKYVTEQAYDHPVFVEDLARNIVLALRQMDAVAGFRLRVVNEESIHRHNAFAELSEGL